MTDFESMTHEEFGKHLCPTVAGLDEYMRMSFPEVAEPAADYRRALVEFDRICMEPVAL